MICTSVVPCLSTGLAKNDKNYVNVCPIFPAFWPFFQKWGGGGGGQTLHQSSQT